MDPGTGTKEVVAVVIVDDHPLVREGTRNILERDASIHVVAEAATGAEALAAAGELEPDVILLDIHLPDQSGIEVARQVNDLRPATKVLMLTAHPDEEYVIAAIAAGAEGFLAKTAPVDQLIAAVHAAAEGRPVAAVGLPHSMPTGARPGRPEGAANGATNLDEPVLTSREVDVLALLAEGLANKAIAFRLNISRRTVEGHISRIFSKVGASCRTELLRYAVQHRLVDLGKP